MINVKFQSKKDNIISFTMKGHALQDRDMIVSGEAFDMICNSVSVLSQSAIIGLDEALPPNTLEAEPNDSLIGDFVVVVLKFSNKVS